MAFADELAALLEIDGDPNRPLSREVSDARRAIEDATTRASTQQPVPERIGRFEIDRMIGAGGMGVVYAGRDPVLRREVAVKVIRGGFVTASVEARMRSEAQAMAKLSHPNVVRVFGMGEHDASFYIAMERVFGRTLDDWQTEHRTSEETLSVYRQAGLGLGALHAVGLVHRDFKPANAMLGDDGRVRVLDLGLAREFGQNLTARQSRGPGEPSTSPAMGTPAYMAPEQILGGQVGPAADQFSFCVALYEALYGRPPFPTQTMEQRLPAVAAGKVAVPERSSVPRRVYESLRRGLSATPEDRFASMDALLDALASGPRTHVLFGSVLSVGLAFGLLSYGPAVHDESCVGVKRFGQVWTPSRRSEVERALRGSTATMSATEIYAEELGDGLVEACASADLQAQICLGELVERFDQVLRFALDSSGDPAVVELIDGLPSASTCDGAERPAKVDINEVSEVAGELQRVRTLAFSSDLGPALDGAGAALRRAQELGAPHLVQQAFYVRGSVHARRKELVEAEADFDSAYQLAMVRDDQRMVTDLALAQTWLAKERLDVSSAEHWLRVASSAYEAQEPAEPDTAALLLLRRGEVALVRGDASAARGWLRQAVEAWASLDSPRDEATALSLLAGSEARLGELDQAIERSEQAVEVLRSAAGPDEPSLASLLHNLGNLYQRLGPRGQESALEAFSRSLEIRQRVHGPAHLSTALSHYALATALFDLGRLEDAGRHYEAALRGSPSEHPVRAACEMGLGMLASSRGEHVEALERGNRALVMVEELFGADHPQTAELKTNLARFKLEAGDLEGALRDARAACPVLDARYGRSVAATVECLDHEASALERLGRVGDAARALTDLLERVTERDGEASDAAEELRRRLRGLNAPVQDAGGD
ncbi:MAG: protein kinase domain-containing protein [Nannocystaceae bacterium]